MDSLENQLTEATETIEKAAEAVEKTAEALIEVIGIVPISLEWEFLFLFNSL